MEQSIVPTRRDAEGAAAFSHRRILDGIDACLRLSHGAQHRGYDALGADIACPRKMVRLLAWWPQDSGNSSVMQMTQQGCYSLEAKAAVFHVDKGELGAGRRQNPTDPGRGELTDIGAELQVPVLRQVGKTGQCLAPFP